MKQKALIIIGVSVLIILFLKLSLFQVSEDKTAFTSLSGKVLFEINAAESHAVFEKREAGVFFKVPFLQKVKTYDKRLQVADVHCKEKLTKDERSLNVSLSVGWKIISPAAFYERSDNLIDMENKIKQICESAVTRIVGSHQLDDFFKADRKNETDLFQVLESEFTSEEKQKSLGFEVYGIQIVFAKISHLGFPSSTIPVILDRMKEERNREASLFAAEAQKEERIILDNANAEKEKKVGEAVSAAAVARSEAQKELSEYYKVLSEDTELAMFLRELEMIRKSFDGAGKKRMIIDPERLLHPKIKEAN